MKLLDFNNLYKDKDIYVIGNGPQLSELNLDEINFINKNVSIGTNSSFICINSNIHMAGHVTQTLLSCHFGNEETIRIFQGEPKDWKFVRDVLVVTDRNIVGYENELTNYFDESNPIIGANNIIFSAMHLALVMGAKRIIFVGVEQRNKVHFYNLNRNYFEILKLFSSLLKQQYSSNEFIKEDIEDYIKYNLCPTEDLEVPFGNWEHPIDYTGQFSSLFNKIREYGVEVISTKKDSIVYSAGAKYLSMEELMKEKV